MSSNNLSTMTTFNRHSEGSNDDLEARIGNNRSYVNKLFGVIPNEENDRNFEYSNIIEGPYRDSFSLKNPQIDKQKLFSESTSINNSYRSQKGRSFTGSSSFNNGVPALRTAEEIIEDHNSILKLIFDLSNEPTITKNNKAMKRNNSSRSVRVSSTVSEQVQRETYKSTVTTNSSNQDVLLTKLRMLQTIHYHTGPIWAMKFSYDGLYLCTAGQDKQIIVWQVGPSVLPPHLNSSSTPTSPSTNSSPLDIVTQSPPVSPKPSRYEMKLGPLHLKTQTSQLITQLELNSPINSEKTESATNQEKNGIQNITPLQIPSMDSPMDEQQHNFGVPSVPDNFLFHDFIQKQPYRIYLGHESDIVDISWSKSQFILSASIDKTVRLWHVTRLECLGKFLHPNILTSVEFHPEHDRNFITGCFDRRIRVWDIIPEGTVREWAQTPDIVTAINFTPDGKMVAGGLINGQVYFYDYEGMKYVTQMNCRNRSGKFSSGRKVTSLNFFSRDMNTGSISSATGNASGAIAKRKLSQSFDDNQLLVATNDNSIRLYSTIDYSIQQKFKGLKNMSMQIKASFSENRKYIISGSDDGKTYIWPTKKPLKKKTWSLFSSSKAVTKNSSYECFDNSVVDGHTNKSVSVATTVSIFCPSRSIENIIMTHPRLTSLVNHDDVELNLDHHDLCTRLIATSDYDGRMTFYLRGV